MEARLDVLVERTSTAFESVEAKRLFGVLAHVFDYCDDNITESEGSDESSDPEFKQALAGLYCEQPG